MFLSVLIVRIGFVNVRLIVGRVDLCYTHAYFVVVAVACRVCNSTRVCLCVCTSALIYLLVLGYRHLWLLRDMYVGLVLCWDLVS